MGTLGDRRRHHSRRAVRRVIQAGAKRVAGTGSAPGAFVPVIPAYRELAYNELAVNPAGQRVVTFRGYESP